MTLVRRPFAKQECPESWIIESRDVVPQFRSMFDLDFSPPEELGRPLWRSLLINFADRFAPERLAPLQLTSKPIDVILLGDRLDEPWFRTVFTNIGDVVSPERLPPLDLELRAVAGGGLLGEER